MKKNPIIKRRDHHWRTSHYATTKRWEEIDGCGIKKEVGRLGDVEDKKKKPKLHLGGVKANSDEREKR